MRVAIVINTSWNIFNYRQGLIKALIANGCEVIAIAPPDEFSVRLKELGCTFVPLPMDNKGMNPVKDFWLYLRMLLVYKDLKPDYILHYTVKPNVFGTLAAASLGIKCISNVSGLGTAFIRKGLLLFVVKQLYRFAFQFPQRIFFQNKDDRDLFLNLSILDKNKTDVLPGSGINASKFKIVEIERNKSFVFLLIARLLADKGILEYAMASKMLKEKGYQFEAQLIGFFDRESKYNISTSELDNWVENGYIRFLGESTNIQADIAKVNCVVLPSYREGTPRSILEAMAMAKPVITTNVPGCKEVLVEGENGFFCESKNAQSLANAMIKMLESSEESLRTMGLHGRKIVEEKFDESIVVEKYLSEIFAKFTTE